jgi:hypothetical protein
VFLMDAERSRQVLADGAGLAVVVQIVQEVATLAKRFKVFIPIVPGNVVEVCDVQYDSDQLPGGAALPHWRRVEESVPIPVTNIVVFGSATLAPVLVAREDARPDHVPPKAAVEFTELAADRHITPDTTRNQRPRQPPGPRMAKPLIPLASSLE